MARKNVNDRGATLWRENEARQKNSSGSGYCPKQILTCIDLQNILTERFQDWTDQDKVPGPGISHLNLGGGGCCSEHQFKFSETEFSWQLTFVKFTWERQIGIYFENLQDEVRSDFRYLDQLRVGQWSISWRMERRPKQETKSQWFLVGQRYVRYSTYG